MKALIRTILNIVLLAMFSVTAYAADNTYYVQSKTAKIYQSKSFTSSVLATLGQGDKITLLEKGDEWAHVKVNSVSGWVPVLLISSQRPVSRQSVLIEKHNTLEQSARRRASSTSVAGAARGLQGDDSKQPAKLKPNYKALEKVEKSSPSKKTVKKFMQEEGLK